MNLILKFSIIVSIVLVSCSHEPKTLINLDFSKRNFEEIALHSNDYVNNWKKVKLETASICLIDPSCQIYPCNDFIIIYTYNRILQFSYSGEFIREIVGPGNGPNEINSLIDCIVDEERGKLYWTELYDPEYIHVFDLTNNKPTNGIPIYAQKPLKTIRLINDTTLLCFPYMGNVPQICYRQNLQGGLLDQNDLLFEDAKGPFVSTPLNIFSLKDEWFYQGLYEDTVYNALSHSAIAVFKKGESNSLNLKEKFIDQNQVLLNGVFYNHDEYILFR